MEEKLKELSTHCTSIHISPYNPNIPTTDARHSCRITADVCTKHPKRGPIQYAKINVDEPDLAKAVDSLHWLVMGYKKLVEQMP